MKNLKSKKLVCLILAVMLVIGCCGCDNPFEKLFSKNDVYHYETESFQAFLDDFFAQEVVCDSITLNYTLAHPENYGITEYEVGYGSTDLEDIDDDSQLIEAINTLNSFDREKLTYDEQLTYDVLKDTLTTALEYSDLYLYSKTLSPTIGLSCQMPVLLAEFSFRTKQDVYDYVELLEQTDEYYQYLLELEKMKAKEGLFMEDTLADQVIEQCNTFIENPEENYLIEIFNGKIDGMECFTAEEITSLKEANKSAVLNHVVPAYDLLAKGLSELKGTGKYEGGLCNYPDGDTYYEYLVYSDTGSARSIDDIDDLIDDYIDNGFDKMTEAYSKNPNIFDEAYDVSFGIEDPYEILDDLQKRITKEFPALPDSTYTIKYVHESLEDNLSPAFYLTPAIDDYSQNVIYINNANQYAGQELYTTLAHEGFPGHLYQTVYTASKKLHPVRSLISYSGYTEGWATYIEMLSYEMGAIDKNIGSFLSANELITLCLYAKCDIGVNYHGWDMDDVGDFFAMYFGELENEVIEEIYYAMVSEPANYLKYVVGCLEFMELRSLAEDTLGSKFDPVAFHDFIMTTGPAPFAVIEERMTDWMDTQ